MKKNVLVILAAVMFGAMVSCKVGKGCPSNGRNVGAERLMGDDKKTQKLVKKAGKFKGGTKMF